MLIFGISLPAKEKTMEIICFLLGKMNLDCSSCSEGFCASLLLQISTCRMCCAREEHRLNTAGRSFYDSTPSSFPGQLQKNLQTGLSATM